MNNKFVIWTVQRTGSTSLANILTLLSGEVVHHEPFNNDRYLAYQGDKETLIKKLEDLAVEQINFKHCWNVHPNWCNDLILDFVRQQNYLVILLHRKNMLKVQLSKELAKQTGIWGKKEKLNFSNNIAIQAVDIKNLKKSMDTYQSQLNKYQNEFTNNHYIYQEICFERLFDDNLTFSEKLQYLAKICQFLNISIDSFTEKETQLYQQLMNNKQNDKQDYEQIPNLEEIYQKFPTYQI